MERVALLDLFSGIGGFSLGLERAGFHTVAFCEIDPWCRRVLAKHWPNVPAYDDVRNLDASRLRADGIERIDAICGGFPCQDISTAGKGAGLDGERSGLWREYARLIGDLRPRFVIVENVGALRGRGLAAVLADFAALGYDAEWHAIPAAAVGAPHLRDRVWIVAQLADADDEQWWGVEATARDGGKPAVEAERICPKCKCHLEPNAFRCWYCFRTWTDPDTDRQRRQRRRQPQHRDEQGASGPESERLGARGWWPGQAPPEPERERREELRGLFGPLARALAAASAPWERTTQPPLRRVDDGIPGRLDRPRLKALGNAVVPLIPELIGRALLGAV